MFRLLPFILALAFVSCASKTDSSLSYETYNQQIEEYVKNTTSTKLVTNYDDIPRFKKQDRHMAPGHLFYLYHPSDEKLKGRYRADFEGVLKLPYNVRLDVKGLSFSELREKVYASYSKFFQRGVDKVDFKLLRRDYFVEVRGFVEKSGRYLVTQNEGIDKVIDKAGGLEGDLQEQFYKASITQQGDTYAISLNQYYEDSKHTNAFTWTGGDKIFVTELDESEMTSALPIITVLGGVNTPGKTLYKANAHLFYYLGKSGGAINNLDYDESYIIRTTDQGISKIHFDLTEMDDIPALAPNDIVLLQSEKRSTMDIVMERLVQFATVVTSIALLMAL